MDYGVVLFDSTSAALRAEKTLMSAGLRVKLIPTPRQISSDCGTALRFAWALAGQVEALLAEKRVPVAGIHHLHSQLAR